MSEQGLASPGALFYDPLESSGRSAGPITPKQRPRPLRRAKRPTPASRREAAVAAVAHDLHILASRTEASQSDGTNSHSATPLP
jgi:hypothetical protein